MIIVASPRVRVLIEVHQDVLDLGLFCWVHDHYYGLTGCHV